MATTTNAADADYQRLQTLRLIAAAFAGVLRGWLSDEEWAEMRRLNATETISGICHSHDHCDANMAMDAAWTMILGRHPRISDALSPEVEANPDLTDADIARLQAEVDAAVRDDTALWDAAWNEAQEKYLTGEATHSCAACTVPAGPQHTFIEGWLGNHCVFQTSPDVEYCLLPEEDHRG